MAMVGDNVMQMFRGVLFSLCDFAFLAKVSVASLVGVYVPAILIAKYVQHYYDLGLISEHLPRVERDIPHVKPLARTHTVTPHCGSHCH